MKKLLQWTLDNLDTTLAVVVSVVAALFGAFGLFQSAVLPAISGALALLAISIIRDRGARDSLMAEIQKLQGLYERFNPSPVLIHSSKREHLKPPSFPKPEKKSGLYKRLARKSLKRISSPLKHLSSEEEKLG